MFMLKSLDACSVTNNKANDPFCTPGLSCQLKMWDTSTLYTGGGQTSLFVGPHMEKSRLLRAKVKLTVFSVSVKE